MHLVGVGACSRANAGLHVDAACAVGFSHASCFSGGFCSCIVFYPVFRIVFEVLSTLPALTDHLNVSQTYCMFF